MSKTHKIQIIETMSELSALVAAGVRDFRNYGDVNTTQHGNLIMFSYMDKCQFKRPEEWNYFERISRGLILDMDTGEVIARPFDKFWNYGEAYPAPDTYIVDVREKVDGSLGIMYWDAAGQPCIATRGSFLSDQAKWATDKVRSMMLPEYDHDWTLLFEIVYPDNRIVVDYGDWEALVLLGARNRRTGEDMSLSMLSYSFGDLVAAKAFTIKPANNLTEEALRLGPNNEGFVIRYNDGQRFKIKGQAYKDMHRWINNFTIKNVAEAILSNRLDSLNDTCPPHYRLKLGELAFEIGKTVGLASSRAWRAHDAIATELDDPPGNLVTLDDKEYKKAHAAIVMRDYKELSSYLFALRDGKDITPMIFRNEFGVTQQTP